MPALICYKMITISGGVTEQEIEAITAFLLQRFSVKYL